MAAKLDVFHPFLMLHSTIDLQDDLSLSQVDINESCEVESGFEADGVRGNKDDDDDDMISSIVSSYLVNESDYDEDDEPQRGNETIERGGNQTTKRGLDLSNGITLDGEVHKFGGNGDVNKDSRNGETNWNSCKDHHQHGTTNASNKPLSAGRKSNNHNAQANDSSESDSSDYQGFDDDSFLEEFMAKKEREAIVTTNKTSPNLSSTNLKNLDETPRPTDNEGERAISRSFFMESFEILEDLPPAEVDDHVGTVYLKSVPDMKKLKENFKVLSEIFSGSKIYTMIYVPGPHFSGRYTYRSTALISNPSCFKFSRLETKKKRKLYWILTNDGILKNRDVGEGVDFNILINDERKNLVTVPQAWDIERLVKGDLAVKGNDLKKGIDGLLHKVNLKKAQTPNSFTYGGCWNFEEFKPMLIIPKIKNLNHIGVWKFQAILNVNDGVIAVGKDKFVQLKKITEIETVKELLTTDCILFQEEDMGSLRIQKKAKKLINHEISHKFTQFKNEFYNKMNHNQMELRDIEKEINGNLLAFVDTLIDAYFYVFTKNGPVDYNVVFERFMNYKPIDLGYLFLAFLNVPYFSQGVNSVTYLNDCFQCDANYKVAYIMMMVAYLQSSDFYGFLLRSLLFRVDLEAVELAGDGFLDFIIDVIDREGAL